MTSRAKDFPWLVALTSTLQFAYGIYCLIGDSAPAVGGFSIGFGVALFMTTIMVWASPMNARRRV